MAPKVELFSSPQCTYCDQAKQLLTTRGIAFENLDVSANDSYGRDLVGRIPRVRSLPQIFINGEHIGGYEDLELLDRTGKLDEIIDAR